MSLRNKLAVHSWSWCRF